MMSKKEKKKLEEEVKACSCGDDCDCGSECNCDEGECHCHEVEECGCDEECSCGCNEGGECSCREEEEHCNCDCDCQGEEDEEKVLLEKKVKDLEEALLRNQAELMNFKRRKEEEVNKIKKYAEENIVKELLPIIDNFERAIKMDDNDLSDEVSKFLTGFKIIYTNTINLLDKFEVKTVEAEGREFDPSIHHAVLTEHDDNKPEGVILEVLQKGYIYKDRVIRPAMVKVND